MQYKVFTDIAKTMIHIHLSTFQKMFFRQSQQRWMSQHYILTMSPKNYM